MGRPTCPCRTVGVSWFPIALAKRKILSSQTLSLVCARVRLKQVLLAAASALRNTTSCCVLRKSWAQELCMQALAFASPSEIECTFKYGFVQHFSSLRQFDASKK